MTKLPNCKFCLRKKLPGWDRSGISALIRHWIQCSDHLLFCSYEKDLEFFKYKVQECNQRCLGSLYDPPKSADPHLFRFVFHHSVSHYHRSPTRQLPTIGVNRGILSIEQWKHVWNLYGALALLTDTSGYSLVGDTVVSRNCISKLN